MVEHFIVVGAALGFIVSAVLGAFRVSQVLACVLCCLIPIGALVWESLKPGINSNDMAAVLGWGLIALAFIVPIFGAAGFLGALLGRALTEPKEISPEELATSKSIQNRNTLAAAAIFDHRYGNAANTHCPKCKSLITVEDLPFDKTVSEQPLNVFCACGYCNGRYERVGGLPA